MSEPKTVNLDVHLSRWVVEDGNYDDFRVRDTRRFALELWAPSPLTSTTERVISMRQRDDHSYSISANLVFAAEGVCILDCGVLAYLETEGKVTTGWKVGDFLRGELKFGVDPFFYFEQHSKIAGIPALVYEWRINAINQDTTPYILSDVAGVSMLIRDETRRNFKAVGGTDEDLAIPPDNCPEFVLQCTKLDTEPHHRLWLWKDNCRKQLSKNRIYTR